MWIKCHLYNGDEIVIQTQNISCVFPNQLEYDKGKTCVQFVGDIENYVVVKESVDEIGRMITE